MKRILFIVFLFSPYLGNTQIIKTIAGTGTIGYTGDGGQASAASITPASIVIDHAKNIYISDQAHSCVRKINTSGVISTVAGTGTSGFSGDGGQATAAQLNGLIGIAVDALDNLYIADSWNNRIRKVNTSGIITTVAGNGMPGYYGDTGPAITAALNFPSDLTVDAAGNIFIADFSNYVIREVSVLGIITTVAGNGSYGYSGDLGPATAAETAPNSVAVDPAGNLYISDGFSCIRKVNTSGIITTIAGTGTAGFSGDGGPATAAKINLPNNVIIDNTGNLFISDGVNERIREVNTSGMISTIAGNGTSGFSGDGGPATAASFHGIGPIAFDSCENIYIVDGLNYRIRKIGASCGTLDVAGIPLSPKANIYPNPAQNSLAITATNKITNITITSLLGQTLYTHEDNSDKVEIDVSALPPGVYIIRINDTEVRRFVKE